ncbi:MAG: PD-(D/E)XK nuclease family protein [Actinomycetota bacterium]|nr:PD-(D/E)XK nuclease family protein [Actinomycetota bacterium]
MESSIVCGCPGQDGALPVEYPPWWSLVWIGGEDITPDTIDNVIEFPLVPPGEPLVVSATLYTTYHKCPDQALGRLRGIYPEESRAAFRGGLAHRVFARHLTDGAIATSEFDRVCKEEIGQGMNAKVGALGLKPSQLNGLIKEVGDLYARFKTLSSDGFRVAEVFVEVEPTKDLTLRGSIDAVFEDSGGIVRLIDWKTGGLYEVEQQLGFYAMLWAMDTGDIPDLVEAVSIGSGERITARPSLDAIEATAASVAEFVRVIRRAFAADRDEIDRTAGPWCRFCALLDRCDEGAAAVRVADAG